MQQSVPATATQADRIRAAMQASIEKQQASVRLQAESSGAVPGISGSAMQLTPQTQIEVSVSLLSRILP